MQASAPQGAIGEGVAMEDTRQFKFESYSQSTKLPRLMCEAGKIKTFTIKVRPSLFSVLSSISPKPCLLSLYLAFIC